MHDKEPEHDSLEMSRRLMADLDELAVELELDMQGILGSMHVAEGQLRVEAAGMAPYVYDDDAVLKLSDALFLPELGGEVLRNGQRRASPTFTKASLELAIRKGQLAAIWKHNKLHVNVGAIKAWAATSEKKRNCNTARPAFEAPDLKSNRQREHAAASYAAVRQRTEAFKLGRKKGK